MTVTTGSRFGIRRVGLALAAGTAVLAVDGTSTGLALASTSPAPLTKAAARSSAHLNPENQVAGSTVTLAAGGYSSATVTCPTGTEVFGGGESNTAGGTLFLTDSWPSSNTSWLVWVKNTGTTSANFTPYAVCR